MQSTMDVREYYEQAHVLASRGDYTRARQLYEQLSGVAGGCPIQALIRNDLAVLAALDGRISAARDEFIAVLRLDPACAAARENLSLLSTIDTPAADESRGPGHSGWSSQRQSSPGARVAVLSFLFNWPSTGGGNVHTAELVHFLTLAGYHVKHFYVNYPPWGIGRVVAGAMPASEALIFDESEWTTAGIQSAFRRAVEGFRPDHVLITDCWNFKPLLAEAVQDYPYILRQQSMECLCPLNNLRVLVDSPKDVTQCPFHQLQAPDVCHRCVQERAGQSGALHAAERQISRVGGPEYYRKLRKALAEAEAVLVLNPLTKQLLEPYCKCVRVVTWGMDPERFPWPFPNNPKRAPRGHRTRLLFAGLVQELIKGFDVLHRACQSLWRKRQDFELLATADPPGQVDDFSWFIGWQSQDELPRSIHDADILVMPTIAQEGLGRTTVEAMGVGRPVIASRIGGLPYTVSDGQTGLLCEPGNAADLAAKIEILLDNPPMREQMGLAGRQRFETDFRWNVVIDRHYRPLLSGQAHVGKARGVDL